MPPLKTLHKTTKEYLHPLVIAGATYLTHIALKRTLNNLNLGMHFGLRMESSLSGLSGPQNSSWSINQPNRVLELPGFGVFGDYLTFILLSIIFNLLIMLFSKVKRGFLNKLNDLKTRKDKASKEQETWVLGDEFESLEGNHVQEGLMIKLLQLIKALIKAILIYTVVFCFFEIAALYALRFSAASEKNEIQNQNILSLPQINRNSLFLSGNDDSFLRILEEEEVPILQDNRAINRTSEKISLAVGRELASFDVEATLILLSRDEKLAYVTTRNPHRVRIYNTSDFRSPKQISLFDLGRFQRAWMFLALSPDETILCASNNRDVILLNISDPKDPRMIGGYKMETQSATITFVSMAFTQDNKYLFITEVGFKILNISNPQAITEVYSQDPSINKPLSGLSASHDRELVFLADGEGALNIFNVSNPRDPKNISTVRFNDSTANSVFLSKDNKLVYVVGLSTPVNYSANAINQIAVNILNVENPLNVTEVFRFKVPTQKDGAPVIQALSPRETKLYVIQSKLITIDLISMSVEDHSNMLIKASNLISIAFTSDSRYTGIAYFEQLVFLELFTDYPNSKIFTPSNSMIGSLKTDRRLDSWSVSQDGNTLFLASKQILKQKPCFEIWDLKNKKAPRKIVSLKSSDLGLNDNSSSLFLKISPDDKKVYLGYQGKESGLIIMDLSKNLDKPTIANFASQFFGKDYNVEFSSNKKILCIVGSLGLIAFFDMQTQMLGSHISRSREYGRSPQDYKIIFAKNDTILFVITSEIYIYNISNISKPIFLSSLSTTEGSSSLVLSAIFSEESNCLFVEISQTFRKLQVYNISNETSPKLISELTLPKKSKKDSGTFAYSEKRKLGFVSAEAERLLKIDLSNPRSPFISGIIPLPTCRDCHDFRFILASDGDFAFVRKQNFDFAQIFALDLQVKSTLYLPHEKFFLGERYSDNVFLLQNAGKQRYEVIPQNQTKVLKLYSYNIQIVSREFSPKISSFSLPDWIKFNHDTFLLTVEPRSKNDLGSYTICAAISNKVDESALNNIGPANNTFKVEEILMTLVSLGYMDRQFYLTTELGTRDAFFLPEQYSAYKSQIYDILQKYYVEDCTTIRIESSLNTSLDKSELSINTLSTETLRVDISLVHPLKHNTIKPRFLKNVYNLSNAEIKDQNSKITMQGTKAEVNLALQNVVINMTSSCDGIVSIYDGLNEPIINETIYNISNYFKKNSPPALNQTAVKTFHEQVDRVALSTGQYFTINWDDDTFTDNFAETLRFDVHLLDDNGKINPLPDWLSFSNLALKGTPPEKITGREIPLRFVASNEFQNITVDFELNIKISPTFALALLIRYSPMILTALGFYIKANKIYNIVFKKVYKHSKEYDVQVGQEISSETIFPIFFIRREWKESQILMKHLLRDLEIDYETERYKLLKYFVDENTRILDKNKIIEFLNKTVSEISPEEKKRLRLYLGGSEFYQRKIIQIFINEIVQLQLNSIEEKATKGRFEEIKNQWADFVEWNEQSFFVINRQKFSSLLEKKNAENSVLLDTEDEEEGVNKTSLLAGYSQPHQENFNQDLLENALISHAFSQQSLKVRATTVHVEMQEKFKRSWLLTFLKFDLDRINLNGKHAVDYGVNCRFKDNMLIFFGKPGHDFKGRTLVVQIQTIQARILKEIWIKEISSDACQNANTTIELSSRRSESSLRGHGYEVY